MQPSIKSIRTYELPDLWPDAALAARYNRLATETTGFIRKTLLNMAEKAQARHRRALLYAQVLDLPLVADDEIRTYGPALTSRSRGTIDILG